MDPSFSQLHKQLEAVTGQKAGLHVVQGGGCSTLFSTMTQTGLAQITVHRRLGLAREWNGGVTIG